MAVIFAVVALFSLTACGGGSAVPVDNDSSSPSPTAVPPPTAAPEPTVESRPTSVPQATATVPAPTAAPTSTPEPPDVFDEFGFSLGLDRGAYINNLPGNTADQGMVQIDYRGVNVILSWVPINGVTTQGLVSGMFEMLQDSQPGLTLETVTESDFTVGLENGLLIGFKSTDSSGEVTNGGLIGAWNCLDEQISFTLTVIGEEASLVQLRFNRLTNNFQCSSG